MDISRLLTDEEAVSSVISVILMVAITVILSAIIGTYALGLGDAQDTAPQSTWKMEYTDGSSDVLELTHESGDQMETSRLYVVVEGASSDGSPNGKVGVDTLIAASEVDAGTTVTLDSSNFGNSLDLSGATVRLVWEDEETGELADSATLAVWEGPDA